MGSFSRGGDPESPLVVPDLIWPAHRSFSRGGDPESPLVVPEVAIAAIRDPEAKKLN